ncbi:MULTISPECIES: MaoC/PaaZ C-terminal domain-containing protein [unclassified Streptomyces]|uniref:MaoC/PaaZ C-terminal domain-containing protein n=1 Tax=unclassified Streptomyces TaxID=2593676 RepID=UPI00225AADF6|nr:MULTISPECIES: MaoC/PaaZ C-terminal domain-containing protein [unclassified Streptomyces]MCX5063108.1 MaoC/PaaZ C-terminal domain-containing protein [Streptomyces sp. NBC_00452]
MTAPTTNTIGDVDFAVPIEDRRFEDYVPGAVYFLGSIAMTEEDILRFARAVDPQGIHTDPQAALRGPYQGLIAGGRHTCPGDRPGARVSRSKPDRGLVHTGIEVLNQHGEPVLTMTAVTFVLRRTAPDEAASEGYS